MRSPLWELDAALAVLERARADVAALPAGASEEDSMAAHGRLESAQCLVSRIRGALAGAE